MNRYERGWDERRRGEDRGLVDRAGDEVRSWFGDEEAEGRRRRDATDWRDRDDREWRAPNERDWRPRDPYYGGAPRYIGATPGRGDWGEPTSEERGGYRSYGGYAAYGGDVAGQEAGRGPSSGKGPYTGRGPKGYQRSDERITEDVCDRLSEHGLIDASEIEVSVQNGEVTLRGTVQSRQAKRWAEDVAESVSAVAEVHNTLRVNQSQGGHQVAA